MPGGILARNTRCVHTEIWCQPPYIREQGDWHLQTGSAVPDAVSGEVGNERCADVIRDGADFDVVVVVVDTGNERCAILERGNLLRG